MPSALSKRLDRLEARAAPPGPTARYVVGSWADLSRVGALFLSPLELLRHSTPCEGEPSAEDAEFRRWRADEALPPEGRLTYHEALTRGVVVETAAFQDEQHAAARRQARACYWHLRHQIEAGERSGDRAWAERYVREARRAVRGEGTYYPGTTPAALRDEATCEDAVWCLERAEHYQAAYPNPRQPGT